jgi:hypothetical protein
MRWMAEPSGSRDRPLPVAERVCFFARNNRAKTGIFHKNGCGTRLFML